MSSSTSHATPLPSAFGMLDSRWWDESEAATLAKPLVELEMTDLSAILRSKPMWWIKYQDPVIITKWRAEALAQAKLMKQSHVDYVLKELDGYAKLRDEESGAEVACYDRIWQSDKLIASSTKEKLLTGVSSLEDIPESKKDWHPRSNDMVLDLVHPSLYPIVYNRTLAYPEGSIAHDAANLRPVSPPARSDQSTRSWRARDDYYHQSKKFQWLPTDFVVSKDGKTVKSLGYINNLNPDQHVDLHHTIEDLVAAFLPLFERVLTDSIPSNHAVPARTENRSSYNNKYAPRPRYEVSDKESWKRVEEWEQNRPRLLPDVSPEGYVLGSLERRETWYSLAGRTIQIIVKLANIHLTPEKPKYAGGSWHVEGMSNESIAASGIYYYDEENITASHLAFRTAASISHAYEQGDEPGCLATWGIGWEHPGVNNLGAVLTCQDRAIAFPNVYQHQVSPFELKDATKPGHRKIVALFLVDPAVRIPSSTAVPPQQHDWRLTALFTNPTLEKLAPEILNQVNESTDGTMTRAEAEAYRIELMDERKAFVAENDSRFFMVKFDMCEH